VERKLALVRALEDGNYLKRKGIATQLRAGYGKGKGESWGEKVVEKRGQTRINEEKLLGGENKIT